MKSFMAGVVFVVGSFLGNYANAAIIQFDSLFQGTSSAGSWTVDGNPATTVLSPNALWVAGPWISNSANAVNGNGNFTFSQSFNISHGSLANGSSFSNSFALNFAADNLADVRVNGTSVWASSNPSYLALIGVDLSSSPLKVGFNTISFVVTNVENPSSMGLLVTGVSGSYDDQFVIPEPASLALWGGLCGLGLCLKARRRRS